MLSPFVLKLFFHIAVQALEQEEYFSRLFIQRCPSEVNKTGPRSLILHLVPFVDSFCSHRLPVNVEIKVCTLLVIHLLVCTFLALMLKLEFYKCSLYKLNF